MNMHRVVRCSALLVICLMLAGGGSVPALAGEASSGPSRLCVPGEELLFGFQMEKSSKFVAFCMNKKEDYLQYRFGTAGKTELEFPKDRKNSWTSFQQIRFGMECDRKGMGRYLAFQSGDTVYTVRDRCFYSDAVDGDAYQVDIEVKNARTGAVKVLMGKEQTRTGSLENIDPRVPSKELR